MAGCVPQQFQVRDDARAVTDGASMQRPVKRDVERPSRVGDGAVAGAGERSAHRAVAAMAARLRELAAAR